MKSSKAIPAAGIALIVATWLLWGLHSYKQNTAAREAAKPALPEITSDVQPMTVDELHARFLRVLDGSMPGHYLLDVDKAAGTVTVDFWTDGMNAEAVNMALRSREYLDKWNATAASIADLCADFQAQASNHGHPELDVIFRLVNCDDLGQIFAVAERGVLTFDVVADTPAGEAIPDPTKRVHASASVYELHDFIVNTGSGVFHRPSCAWADEIAAYNRASFTGDRADLIAQGFRPCEVCDP